MNIIMVTSEAVPFSKSGGLADVIGALPHALNAMGHNACVFVPSYNTPVERSGERVCSVPVELCGKTENVLITRKTVEKTVYYFVCHPFFNERLGIYGDTSFTPYNDNFERFSVLCKAVPAFCKATGFVPDIIHCHDWTSGLVPYFLKQSNDVFFRDTKTVFTIHNLAYQGTFQRMSFLLTGYKSDEALFRNGQINMMQAGIVFSDYVTTVSPTYAKEIQTSLQGCGLEEILAQRSKNLSGIVNGIDVNEWNPQTDSLIDEHFSVDDLSGKAKLKRQIQTQFNLPIAPDVPLFAMISRLASQKGFDVLVSCLENILKTERLQLIIIGTGDSSLENALLDIASKNENLSVNILFSNKAAHLVEAGSDFFIMPSRYEPCGLNQLYSLRYGTIPVARRTGGLADTIIDIDSYPDSGTGLLFDELCTSEIESHIHRAVELYGTPGFDSMIKRAMSRDFSWQSSAAEYVKIYEKLTLKGKK